MSLLLTNAERLVLTRYVLGQLTATEQDQVEDRFSADPDYFAQYEEVERGLLREYAAETMAPADGRLFERNYLVTSKRREQVVLLKALLEVQAKKVASERERWRHGWKLVPVLASVMLIVLGVYWTQRHRSGPVEVAVSRPTVPYPSPANMSPRQAPTAESAPTVNSDSRVDGANQPADGAGNSGRVRRPVPLPVGPAAIPKGPAMANMPEAPDIAPRAVSPATVPLLVESAAIPPRPATTSVPEAVSPRPRTVEPAAGGTVPRAPGPVVEQQIRAQYPVARVGANGAVLQAGQVLVVQLDGIQANPATLNPSYYRNEYRKDRKVTQALMAAVKRMPVGGPGAVPKIQAGDKVYLTGIEIKDKEVVLSVQSCGVCDPAVPDRFPLRAALAFQFPKGYLGTAGYDAIQGVIGQVFAVDTSPPAATDAEPPPAVMVTAQPQQPAAPTLPATPVTINLGDTIDQVVAAMGQPDRKAKVANKDIYFYKDMKITFVDGKVSDIQ